MQLELQLLDLLLKLGDGMLAFLELYLEVCAILLRTVLGSRACAIPCGICKIDTGQYLRRLHLKLEFFQLFLQVSDGVLPHLEFIVQLLKLVLSLGFSIGADLHLLVPGFRPATSHKQSTEILFGARSQVGEGRESADAGVRVSSLLAALKQVALERFDLFFVHLELVYGAASTAAEFSQLRLRVVDFLLEIQVRLTLLHLLVGGIITPGFFVKAFRKLPQQVGAGVGEATATLH